ncbi:hypothetical protein EKO04_011592 [Ascochyta lentis]|uniref:Uncharacterized protein n=1 Tax=Ascochyta lentis TaxID=205686 RepID=A0A8H7ITX0_9PLEO|nr:hypothetical protein EKO04_011592 [Ascochyta lentis]
MAKRRCSSTGRFLTDTPEDKKPRSSTAAQPDSGGPSRLTNDLMAHVEPASSAITRAFSDLAPHQELIDRTTPQVTLARDLADMEFYPPDATPAPSESGESSFTNDILYNGAGLTMTRALHASMQAAIQRSFLVTDFGEEDEFEVLYLRDSLVFNVHRHICQVIFGVGDDDDTIYDTIVDTIFRSQLREKKLSAMTEAVEPNVDPEEQLNFDPEEQLNFDPEEQLNFDPEEQIGAWSRVLAQQLTNLVAQSIGNDYRACKLELDQRQAKIDQRQAENDHVSVRFSSTLDRIMDGITKLKDTLKDHMARHVAMDMGMDAKQAEARAEVWIQRLGVDGIEEDLDWLDINYPFVEDA